MSEQPPTDRAEAKSDARGGRLSSMKNIQEEAFRKKFQRIALDHCNAERGAFAECAVKEGFFVVFNCRETNATMNNCLGKFDDAAFDAYLHTQGYARDPNKRKSWIS